MAPGFRMTLAGGGEGLSGLHAAFAEFAESARVPADVRRGLQVVLDELLANVVSYGLAGRADGEATVEVACVAERVEVTVSDNGPAFDPLARAAPDTTLSVEARPIGGLGIHLVRQMVDEVTYQRRGDRNVVQFSKRLDGEASTDQPGGQ